MWFVLLTLFFTITHAENVALSCPPSKESIDDLLSKTTIPGMAAIVVNRTSILYSEGFGYSSPILSSRNQRIDPEKSIFTLASISKTFIAVAAMQLVEIKLLNLDKSINEYLPATLQVQHPMYPDQSISMKHLLSHTSGIGPNVEIEMTHYVNGDDFTQTNLTETVFTFIRNRSNWLPNQPGDFVHYSNIGTSLAALVIGYITNQSFEQYLHHQILQPLGLTRDKASYRLSDFRARQSDIVQHYIYNASWLQAAEEIIPTLNFSLAEANSNWIHVAPFSIKNYPAGLLRMSAHSLSIYLKSFLNNFPGVLSQAASTMEMIRVVANGTGDAQFGLIWFRRTIGQRRLLGHTGSMPGVYNIMMANQDRTLGVIVLSNGDINTSEAVSRSVSNTTRNIVNHLFDCFE